MLINFITWSALLFTFLFFALVFHIGDFNEQILQNFTWVALFIFGLGWLTSYYIKIDKDWCILLWVVIVVLVGGVLLFIKNCTHNCGEACSHDLQ